MFNVFEKLKAKLLLTLEDMQMRRLMNDISALEVNTWLTDIIEQMAYRVIANPDWADDTLLPPDTLEVWRAIGPYKQELAFFFLLGAIRGFMESGDGYQPVELPDTPKGEGPGERRNPPDPPRMIEA